ncbi:MAG: TonB-dependent receptor [Ignavibacteriales bacterium]|nr:MAG: TonB-dependent receptor [Ignavibacteriales bacterium]
MLKRFTLNSFLILLILQIITYTSTFAARNGSIRGTITDAQSGDALPYANVVVMGTSYGDAADASGNYSISNIPPGNYTIRASYLGYKNIDLTIKLSDGQTLVQDFELSAEGVIGSEVVVTAQAKGQYEAINEQLNSIAIKNVVSMAKIRELPDVNAAESVSRLPGVSLIRTGGEGSKVVVRGLSPQYNRVTIDGVELPANVTSSDPNDHKSQLGSGDQISIVGDRAADLSMISSNTLGGIEVVKAITPDMDATVFGGVINFSMRKAQKTEMGIGNYFPQIEINTQGTYNNLKNSAKDYKVAGSFEKRLFDNGLGIFVQGSVENRNLSSQELGANYFFDALLLNTDEGNPIFEDMTLKDAIRDRDRYNGTVVFDYEYESGSIGLMNFFSKSKTKSIFRNESYYLEDDDLYNSAIHSNQTLDVYSNLLSFKQNLFGFIQVDARLSHSYSYSSSPEDVNFRFWQNGTGFHNKITALKYKSPKEIASHVVHDPENSALFSIYNVGSVSKDRVYNAGLDLTSTLTFTQDFSALVKFGGAFQYRDRAYDYNEMSGSVFYDDGGQVNAAIRRAYPQFGDDVTYADFIDANYSYGTFLHGDYILGDPFNADLMMNVIEIAKKNPGTGNGGGYKLNKISSIKDDYSGNEARSAGYIMATINIGQMFTVIPGIRYQNLTTDYSGIRAKAIPNNLIRTDAKEKVSHGYWLPMFHFRVKPLEWLQFHFAYTNTLNYADYNTIIPKFYIGTNWIEYNNYKLKPARSENFDAVLSVYANEIGLFTFGGFKKNIKDLIFSTRTHPDNFSQYPELNSQIDKKQSYTFFTTINNPLPIDVYGFETEWQTHLWYLPSPFNGIVFNINYTHIFSEAKYPKTLTLSYLDSNYVQQKYYYDTLYTTRLLNQPNDVLNISFGYDYADFSIRASMLYQDNIFKKPDFWKQNRGHSDKYVRFDLSVKQILPWFGLQVYVNLNNISGEDDIDINQQTGFYTKQERYGMTADFGLRMNL